MDKKNVPEEQAEEVVKLLLKGSKLITETSPGGWVLTFKQLDLPKF